MYGIPTSKTIGVMQKTYFTQSFIKQCVLVFGLLWTAATAQAQQKVDGVLQIMTPYPIKLSNYASAATNNVKLTLTLNGLWEASPTPVKLSVTLEKGNSLIAQSDANVSAPKVTLAPNIPYTFTAAEMAPYFQLNNLQGINTTLYNQTFTEGVYRLTFRAYNANSGQLISDAISQQFWIIENESPLLNMPRTGDNIKNTLTAPINFQWIPRAIQNSARTEYDFTLTEITAANANNPYPEFIGKAPLFTRTVSTPALSINPSQLRLVATKTYAWRVKARSLDVFNNEVSSYKNGGYSDIFTFRYASTCDKPLGLALEAKSSDMVTANWTANSNHISYRVAYRKYVAGQNWKWIEQATANNFTNLTQLEPNTEYQVTVGGLCAENFLTYSDTLIVKTLALGDIKGVTCGQLLPTDLTNRTPLASLPVGDSIKAGDFSVIITRIAGGAGNFTGQGYVKVPWMGDTKLKVVFKGISVNTDKKLIGGFMETVYDPEWKSIIDADAAFQQIKDAIQTLYDLILTSIDKDADEINAMIDLMRETLAKDLPDDLKIRLNQALTDLEAAKKAYDKAKKAYNDATTQAGKDTALAAMKSAEQNFKNAQGRLDAVNKEKDQFIDNIINILVKSVKEMRTQTYTDTKIASLKKDMDSKATAYDKFITDRKKTLFATTPPTPVATTNVGADVIILSIETIPIDNGVEPSERIAYKEAERAYNRAILVKAFANDANKLDAYKLLAKYLDIQGESYVAYITRRKKEGAADPILITATKELLTDFLETAVNHELKQK